ncbi:hypothetical protein [Bilophila wadsworthia]|uniref:hypothetical protein n=1 Tax=Bilophila wadsworthia TaxID=35833 RepID=UPI00242C5F83|nr:hypothetical protein [Bilophila wadsworthia]
MPVTNEILPFAPQATVALSEILSLAEYTVDSQRLRGNQPGIARLELVNTVLKQTSHMTAGLAQFIANRYDGGVKDDGNLDAVESGLQAAIMSLVSGVTDPLSKTLATLEAIRKSWIGAPRYHRSTVLPPDYAWVNGDLILFEDRPEFEEVYLAGGFEGMLLEANATSEQIAANLGKFRKHPNGLGLYLPSCGEQFFRAWGSGTNGAAGGYNAPGLPEIEGHFDGCDLLGDSRADWSGAFIRDGTLYGNVTVAVSGVGIELPTTFSARASNPIYGSSATVMPASINLPVILYLGILA